MSVCRDGTLARPQLVSPFDFNSHATLRLRRPQPLMLGSHTCWLTQVDGRVSNTLDVSSIDSVTIHTPPRPGTSQEDLCTLHIITIFTRRTPGAMAAESGRNLISRKGEEHPTLELHLHHLFSQKMTRIFFNHLIRKLIPFSQ